MVQATKLSIIIHSANLTAGGLSWNQLTWNASNSNRTWDSNQQRKDSSRLMLEYRCTVCRRLKPRNHSKHAIDLRQAFDTTHRANWCKRLARSSTRCCLSNRITSSMLCAFFRVSFENECPVEVQESVDPGCFCGMCASRNLQIRHHDGIHLGVQSR